MSKGSISLYHIVPLGMEDHRINDSQITASSYHNPTLAPWLGRLNVTRLEGAWAARYQLPGEFLEIDLNATRVLVKVATQGRAVNAAQYATLYSLQHRIDGGNWSVYNLNGRKKVSAS